MTGMETYLVLMLLASVAAGVLGALVGIGGAFSSSPF